LRLVPKLALVYYNRGNAYKDKKEYQKAIENYSQAISIDNPAIPQVRENPAARQVPRFPDFQRPTNFPQLERGRKRDNKDCAGLRQLGPHLAAAYVNRGDAYSKTNECDKAIEDFSQALVLGPKDANAHLGRGSAYYFQNEYDKAIADYTQAI